MHLEHELLWRFIPLLHAGIFGTLAVVGRIVFAYGVGRNALSFSSSGSVRDYVARHFYVWLPVVDGAFLVFYAVTGNPGPWIVKGLAAVEAIRWCGVACLFIALIWVVAAQSAMGASWRMGVDDQVRTDLITSGPFAVSRNPIYLGVRLTLFGQVLLVQTWPVLLCFVVCDLLAQIQVRFEEVHMSNLYPAEYAAYCARVRRWL
ncbi:methyltransferase family protein [Burkholderia cenocepacia]|uniref:methyltransferase family protein n=1 Tax=Burkholderia cenocepacia TaxID=95486 RepID=UPI002AB7A7C2|nr:isoprenylcysteine carboxylmethyltransferase family protein [Burkholderia cenocepacia]